MDQRCVEFSWVYLPLECMVYESKICQTSDILHFLWRGPCFESVRITSDILHFQRKC